MSQQPPSEKDPIQAELEAALRAADGLDFSGPRRGPSGLRGAADGKPGAARGAGPRRTEAQRGHDLLKGTVVGIDAPDVIIELGPRTQGVIALTEFDEPPTVGQTFEFSLNGQKDGLWILSRRRAKALAAWNHLEVGSIIEGQVSGVNTGGVELAIGPLTAFMPASQVALGHTDNLQGLLGQRMAVEVVEVDPTRKRLVVSRRRVLAAEREELREQVLGHLSVGDEVQGRVTRVESFGAFVDLGGVEGLVHVSQLSHRRIEDAKTFVAVGDTVRARVSKIEEGGKKIGLSMKAMEPDPLSGLAGRYPPERVVSGKVTRLEEFGAFVELEPGLEGLLHVSQIARGGERVRRARDVLSVGQEVPVRVLSVDADKRRISLSRLDERGAVLGSEEAVDSADLGRLMDSNQRPNLATNLGSLFKRAMDKDGGKPGKR
jgi:small subunit ribosomal protein S1